MKNSFKISHLLTTSCTALTLMMGLAPVSASDATEEDGLANKNACRVLTPEQEKTRKAATTHNNFNYLFEYKNVLMMIVRNLDPQDLPAVALTCTHFNDFLKEDQFLIPYYISILNTKLSPLFGEEIAGSLQVLLDGKITHFHGQALLRLISPKNSALLTADDSALFKEIIANCSPEGSVSAKALLMASYADAFFTEKMTIHVRDATIEALETLPDDTIPVIAQNVGTLLSENMEVYDLVRIFNALGELRPAIIPVIVQNFGVFVTEKMDGYQRIGLIKTLAKHSVASINAIVQNADIFLNHRGFGENACCLYAYNCSEGEGQLYREYGWI